MEVERDVSKSVLGLWNPRQLLRDLERHIVVGFDPLFHALSTITADVHRLATLDAAFVCRDADHVWIEVNPPLGKVRDLAASHPQPTSEMQHEPSLQRVIVVHLVSAANQLLEFVLVQRVFFRMVDFMVV
ncbi:hypothetical protein [Natrinema sp. 1APR25-10V2]|uniref:hypothetical protein n=1 Tax=Natrinema sp. 1APR25-10V2 TaxID=2951081 RepID=UPI0028743B6F|nr:hypothetical protein [Natrinema sp. 1APR25-10V2]MDS0475693.1 hypothetical protein [Natrinema sp. 1APR25-10V2]